MNTLEARTRAHCRPGYGHTENLYPAHFRPGPGHTGDPEPQLIQALLTIYSRGAGSSLELWSSIVESTLYLTSARSTIFADFQMSFLDSSQKQPEFPYIEMK